MSNPYELPIIRSHFNLHKPCTVKSACNPKQNNVVTETELGSSYASSNSQKLLKPIKPNELTALATLVNPPPQFCDKIRLDTQHFDLRWLFKAPCKPPPPEKMLTLTNMRQDLFSRTSSNTKMQRTILLNSPRSVIVLLRNGVDVVGLQQRTLEQCQRQGGLEGTVPEAIEKRYEYLEQKRQRLLQELIEEYKWQTEQLSMEEIVAFFDAAATTEHPPDTLQPIQSTGRASVTGNAGQSHFDNESMSPAQQVVSLSIVPVPELVPAPTEPMPTMSHSASSPSLSQSQPAFGDLQKSSSAFLTPTSTKAMSLPSPLMESQFGGSFSWASWSARKIEDSKTRVNKIVDSNIHARERAAEQRKKDLALSILRVLEFEKSVKERKEVLAAKYSAKAEAQQQNVERHQQVAAQRMKEMEEKSKERFAKKQEMNASRQQTVDMVNAQRQAIAAKNKQRREEKRSLILSKQAQAEEQRLQEYQEKERERQQRRAKLEAEKQAMHEELRVKSMEHEEKQRAVQQRSTMMELQKRLIIEDKAERSQRRVDEYMSHKGAEAAVQRAEDIQQREEKRKRVTTAAKQRLQEWHEEIRAKQETFEERYHEMQAAKELECRIKSEEHRLKGLDKLQFQERCRNASEFDKLLLIDEIQRKSERKEKAEMYKEAVQQTIRHDYEEKQRDRDRIIAEMEAEEIQTGKRIMTVLYSPKGGLSRSRSLSAGHLSR